MKKIWVLVLLVSVGLNLGLGLRLLQNQVPCPVDPEVGARGQVQGSSRLYSPADTTRGLKMADRRLDRLAKHLHLTPEQMEIFSHTRADVGSRMMVRRLEMQGARANLLELVADESISTETLRRSLRDLTARQGAIDSVITEVLLRELEILDTEQRILYLDMLPSIQRGPSGMHGRGRGRRGQD